MDKRKPVRVPLASIWSARCWVLFKPTLHLISYSWWIVMVLKCFLSPRPWRFTTGNHLAIHLGTFYQGAAQRSQSQDGAEETQGTSNCYSSSCTLYNGSFIYSCLFHILPKAFSSTNSFGTCRLQRFLNGWYCGQLGTEQQRRFLLLLLSLWTCSLVMVHCLACYFNALSGRLLQDRALLQAFYFVILCRLPHEETEWFCQVCIIQPMGIFGMRLPARNVANDTTEIPR